MFGLLTLKVAAVTAVVSVAGGFYAGTKWVKADLYEDVVAQVEAIQVQATKSINTLNERWENEAARVKIDVESWHTQDQYDNTLILELIDGQFAIRNKFNELTKTIQSTEELGTCKLNPTAIELLREASAAANARANLPSDRDKPSED